jgi:hypothetical protein
VSRSFARQYLGDEPIGSFRWPGSMEAGRIGRWSARSATCGGGVGPPTPDVFVSYRQAVDGVAINADLFTKTFA